MVGIRLSSKQCGVIEDKPIAPEPIIPLDQLVAPAPSKPRRAKVWPQFIGLGIVLGSLALFFWRSQVGWVCPSIPLLVLGWFVCVLSVAIRRPRWPAAIGLAVATLCLAAGGYDMWRTSSGHLHESDYPDIVASYPAGTAHFPAQIPAGVTGVRLFAHGPFELLLPPNFHIELRYLTTPAEAAKVLAAAKKRAISANLTFANMSYDTVPESLATADDADTSTPLPAGYQSFILTNPNGGGNVGGVTVSVQRGEVIYWLFEM